MFRPGRLARWRWLAVALLAIVLAACGGDQSTPTPAPTPTPTPIPRLDIGVALTIRNLVEQMPDRDAECMRLELVGHSYEDFLAQELDFALGNLPNRTVERCFSNETLLLLLVGQIELQVGGLSDPSIACIRQTLGVIDMTAAAGAVPGEGDARFGAAVGLLLCLADDETQRIEVSSILGDAVPMLADMTLGDLRCVLESADLQTLRTAFEQIAAGGLPDHEVVSALTACAARS